MGFFSRSVPAPLKSSGGNTEQMLLAIIASMEDALLVYDENFTVLLVNPAAERLFAIKAADILGKAMTPKNAEDPSLRRLTQIIFPTLAPTIVPRSKSGEYPQVVDISFDDPYLELRTSTSPISDPAGKVRGFMKIIRDRTREVSLAKTKTEFIAVASHQLRTPITNLEWSLETLAGDPSLADALKEIAQGALGSIKQLHNIVEDLLSITKIEEGRFGYNFQPTDLSAYLEKFMENVLPQARRVGISVYLDKPAEALPQVQIDQQKIGMVLQNLVDNAIRYNVENGTVTVGLKKAEQGPYLEISVKDTGIGIPPAEAQKLFTKFYRASNAVKSAADGSGLGLYIAKNVILAHGGKIWAESEINRGSTFRFTIPTDPSLIPPKEVPLEF